MTFAIYSRVNSTRLSREWPMVVAALHFHTSPACLPSRRYYHTVEGELHHPTGVHCILRLSTIAHQHAWHVGRRRASRSSLGGTFHRGARADGGDNAKSPAVPSKAKLRELRQATPPTAYRGSESATQSVVCALASVRVQRCAAGAFGHHRCIFLGTFTHCKACFYISFMWLKPST